ncbi:hypothetical protein SAMN05428959_102265 [Duganella sp. CF517]|uniref:XAC2610-related protein n=1 Tax=Duganella sp. CF517 TaxID=1881038 RepID=UPI0008D65967|nr:hypothetical protein [Duganella sp. CF517]SEN52942.1 hypothetical protein SAMN05428959_102265 [Duganella sp. CF517]
MKTGCMLLTLMLGLAAVTRAGADSSSVPSGIAMSFAPKPGTLAQISVDQNLATVTLHIGPVSTVEAISVEAEQKIDVKVADYNFDGYQDFSLSHIDDGMGTYQMYQIYVFSAVEQKFVRLQPSCGDDFINVVLSTPAQRRLTHSYFSDSTLKSCAKSY